MKLPRIKRHSRAAEEEAAGSPEQGEKRGASPLLQLPHPGGGPEVVKPLRYECHEKPRSTSYRGARPLVSSPPPSRFQEDKAVKSPR
ncbi:hypothetical protein NDU88_005472 [Pleurodeles waltl]|uniref:Uncharacterized protein n=1 Tax=Pleurodeles waltl TaxID=8319 RepID=A0AAV7QG23_PLEWA|nr:hypothetical protein NDU88_005472 [Pleurodeles waltl]